MTFSLKSNYSLEAKIAYAFIISPTLAITHMEKLLHSTATLNANV